MPKIIQDCYGLYKADGEVGIEVEMEGQGLADYRAPDWRFHNDGSLRGDSAEFVLHGPCQRNRVGVLLRQLRDGLKDAKLDPSDRCGVHVHLNMQQLTVKQVYSISILYLVMEELLVHWCGDSREGNLFCLRAVDAEAIIEGLYKVGQSLNENLAFEAVGGNMYRYASINFGALSKFGSLEFRAMQTPKQLGRIETWVKLLLCIKDMGQRYADPKDIVESASAMGYTPFVRQVFGDMTELLECRGMDKMIEDGLRRVQDCAYVQAREKKKRMTNTYTVARAAPVGEQVVFENVAVNNYENQDRVGIQWRALAPDQPVDAPIAEDEAEYVMDPPDLEGLGLQRARRRRSEEARIREAGRRMREEMAQRDQAAHNHLREIGEARVRMEAETRNRLNAEINGNIRRRA